MSHLQGDHGCAHLVTAQRWEATRSCVHGCPVFGWEASCGAPYFHLCFFAGDTCCLLLQSLNFSAAAGPALCFGARAGATITIHTVELISSSCCKPFVAKAFLLQVQRAQDVQGISRNGYNQR